MRQLQALLDRQALDKWEVISLAASGFGTLEEMIMLEEIGYALDPDIVILQILPGNDVCNNAKSGLNICDDYPYRPYAFERWDGSLRRTSGQPIRNVLRRHSALFNALEKSF